MIPFSSDLRPAAPVYVPVSMLPPAMETAHQGVPTFGHPCVPYEKYWEAIERAQFTGLEAVLKNLKSYQPYQIKNYFDLNHNVATYYFTQNPHALKEAIRQFEPLTTEHPLFVFFCRILNILEEWDQIAVLQTLILSNAQVAPQSFIHKCIQQPRSFTEIHPGTLSPVEHTQYNILRKYFLLDRWEATQHSFFLFEEPFSPFHLNTVLRDPKALKPLYESAKQKVEQEKISFTDLTLGEFIAYITNHPETGGDLTDFPLQGYLRIMIRHQQFRKYHRAMQPAPPIRQLLAETPNASALAAPQPASQ